MLSLTLKPGEYMTIGENVVVQYDRTVGMSCKLMVNAPREVPIVRGKLLEESGEKRPDCVVENTYKYRQSIPWDKSKNELLSMIVEQLDEISEQDDRAENVKRRILALFPVNL